MGGAEIVPATKKEVEEYFSQDLFTKNESLNLDRFRSTLSNEYEYVGYQNYLQNLYKEKNYKISEVIDVSIDFW